MPDMIETNIHCRSTLARDGARAQTDRGQARAYRSSVIIDLAAANHGHRLGRGGHFVNCTVVMAIAAVGTTARH